MTKGHNMCPDCGHTIKRKGSLDDHKNKCKGKLKSTKTIMEKPRLSKLYPGECELCERQAPNLHGHHLKPAQYGYGVAGNTMNLCIDCTRMIHALITNKEMKNIYHTKEMILALPPIQDYLKWIKNRRVGVVKHPKMLVDKKVMKEIRRLEK